MPNAQPRPITVFDLSDRLTFGKYKGCEVRTVCKHHPTYINWMKENVTWARLTPETLRFLQPYLEATRFQTAPCRYSTYHRWVGIDSYEHDPDVEFDDDLHDLS